MQGYDPKIDAAELVRRHGPEKAQQIIAEFMRDRGMSDRNSEIWSGLDVRTAQRGMEPADLSDGMAGAPQSTVGDDAGLDGQDGSGRDWGNWKPGMPLPAEGPDKSVLADNARRAREAERVAANSRERNEAIGQKYGPKAQEIAEAGDARGVTDYDATRKPINQQRLNDRREIEAAVDAGVGGAQSDLRELNQAGATKRKEFRDKLAASSSSNFPSEKDRWANYRAQMMLAGANPRKNMANAWSMMNDPGVSDAQSRSLQYMLPGGQLAAQVDASGNAQAFALARQMALGAGFQDHSSPAAQAALTAKAAQAQEALPPEAAAEAERARNGGVLPATSSAGQRLLRKIETEYVGSFALESEVGSAVDAAVAAGVPRAEAEQFFSRRRKSWSEWAGFGADPTPPAQKPATPYNPPAPHGL
jgi:hypothetical protein